MLKLKIGRRLILGLSDENVKRLRENWPIRFRLSEVGFVSGVNLWIEYGGELSAAIRSGKDVSLKLSDGDLALLLADKVCETPPEICAKLFLGDVEEVSIFQDRNEVAMHDWLKRNGLIGPQTRQIIDPTIVDNNPPQ